MTTRVQVSSKNQISIPTEVREKLLIRPGDTLILEVRDGSALLRLDPSEHVERLRELYGWVWEGVDVDAYLRELRGSCKQD